MVALSWCGAELYAACKGLKEAILITSAMECLRMGSQKIDLLMDSSAARQVCHKRGARKQKHLKV